MAALELEVKALQNEIARLREQLTKIDQQLQRLQRAPGSGAPLAGAEASKGGTYVPSSCTQPYFMVDGIKRFRTECMASLPCDPPFFLDPDGIKRYRTECIRVGSESVDDSCSPPYDLTEDGTKLFKKQCL